MQNNYIFNVGEADRLRLTILSKLYNPPAMAFLQRSGVKPGMTVLEIGCGTGHMACDLAKYLGPSGKVMVMSNEEVDLLLNELAIFEQSDAISGFFQNILISGIK